MAQPIDTLQPFFQAHAPRFIEMSNRIWSLAELRYEEKASALLHTDGLSSAGFRIEQPLAGIPTAFTAEYGEGGPVIGLLGEYDALSGLSQQSGAMQCMPSAEGSGLNGHGCGHHLLGSASHLAALAVQEYLRTHKLPGRVRFYGCPAEEGGSGKTFMARAGVFDDLDAALTWHPSSHTGVFEQSTLANIQARFAFKGRASHAANAPHLGRSALDAVELMNVGVNYLREHMPPNARVHYAVTDSGGLSPNVVQARAEVLYLIRAAQNYETADLYRRVQDIAKGAALMTGCQVEVRFDKACSNLMQNHVLNEVLYAQMQHLGPLPVGNEEHSWAQQHQATLSADDIAETSRSLGEVLRGKATPALFDGVKPYEPGRTDLSFGSTDVSDVSWVTPTAQAWVSCYAFGTPFHSWQMVSQGQSSLAHIGMLQAAKFLAGTALALLTGPQETLQAARAELLERRGGPYICPIPPEVPLPFKATATTLR